MTMYMLLAEILIVSALLLIGYRLLLERHTDFRWCCLYLVTLPLLSVVIPLLEIPFWHAKTALLPTITIDSDGVVAAGEVIAVNAPTITLQEIFVALYSIGVVALVALLIYQWWRIHRLESDAEIGTVDSVRIVRTSVPVASFSFFRTIYVNCNTSAEDLAVIIKHECSHIAHRHSYERLAMELQKALLWWNPFVWYAARLLTEVEEFEADRDVLSKGEDRTIYIQTIFKQMFGYSPEIANSLRNSLTKKRFIMMTTNFRSRYARLRQAAILPLMLALVAAFGTTARAAQEQDEKKKLVVVPNIDKDKQPIYLVDGKVVENINKLDADMIASMSILKGGEQLQEAVKNTSISVEEATRRHVVVIEMIKPENLIKQGEEALYRGVVLDYDNKPFVGAIIKIGQRNVVTDMNGRFEMRATRGEVGKVMMVGYESAPLHFANNAELTVRLAKEGEAKKIGSDAMATVIKADKMPSFRGGNLEDFRRWVMTQVCFPKEMMDKGVYGRVVACFVVDTDGSVSNVDILQTPDKAYTDEVIRVLMKSPKWEAGVQKGKPVKVKFTIPVDFARYDGGKVKGTQEKAPKPSPTTASEVVVVSYGKSSEK